jgi:hypothetical protein
VSAELVEMLINIAVFLIVAAGGAWLILQAAARDRNPPW